MFLPVVSFLYSQTLAVCHTAALLLLSWRQILLFCGRSHKTVAVNYSHASCVQRATFHPGHLIGLRVFLQEPEADDRLEEGLNGCVGSGDSRRPPEQRGYLRSSSGEGWTGGLMSGRGVKAGGWWGWFIPWTTSGSVTEAGPVQVRLRRIHERVYRLLAALSGCVSPSSMISVVTWCNCSDVRTNCDIKDEDRLLFVRRQRRHTQNHCSDIFSLDRRSLQQQNGAAW